jgi:hypothetical protein
VLKGSWPGEAPGNGIAENFALGLLRRIIPGPGHVTLLEPVLDSLH